MPALVATLVADPARARLSDAGLEALAQAAPGFGRRAWLNEGVAADLFLDAEPEVAKAALAVALQGEPIDIIVQPQEGRRKRLLVADMDSTMIGQECIDELARRRGHRARGRGHHRARHARRDRLRAGAARARRDCSRACPPASIDERASRAHHAQSRRADVGANHARPRRACVLVSGGFSFFTSRVAERAGFDGNRANTSLDDGAALTGEVASRSSASDAKLEALQSDGAEARYRSRRDARRRRRRQ